MNYNYGPPILELPPNLMAMEFDHDTAFKPFFNLSSKIVIAHFIFCYSGHAPLIQSKKRANTELGAGLYICRSRVCCPGTTRKVTLPYP